MSKHVENLSCGFRLRKPSVPLIQKGWVNSGRHISVERFQLYNCLGISPFLVFFFSLMFCMRLWSWGCLWAHAQSKTCIIATIMHYGKNKLTKILTAIVLDQNFTTSLDLRCIASRCLVASFRLSLYLFPWFKLPWIRSHSALGKTVTCRRSGGCIAFFSSTASADNRRNEMGKNTNNAYGITMLCCGRLCIDLA